MKANAVGKKCVEVTRAYLAGFLDADGAIMATIERHQEKKFGFRVRIIVKISQRNRAVLDWFRTQFAVGSVVSNRTTHDWLIRDQQAAATIIRLAYPYLRVKKRQAEKALEIMTTPIGTPEDLLMIARQADALSGLDVRSYGRRKNSAAMVQAHFSSND